MSTDYSPVPEGKDPYLWQIAVKRASFRRHLRTYVIINAFLWAIWFLTGSRHQGSWAPWPVWPTLGWGIGLAFHYADAYMSSGRNRAEEEYQKLTRNNQNL